ncbi:ImmA/IrrE family metallo-endopeptidase [Natroniella sulfidigena]|uniref:ImmA/IrrE family metallo-endopeptidase n=1 Tax=Natroniella sulfidigena TaxID=723921 RepID=UPI00200B0751|nr:ImmA/IrrE family metallo-endopeptidase [Natroniella sulfidigena]MCK8816742.1 ImmA/IrrE family metallo-endopeptidase [Natroniella sulfidigena]
MKLIEQTIKNVSEEIYADVKKEVLYVRGELAGANDMTLGERIFKVVEEKGNLIKFPIADEELSGFICEYKGEVFVYINTYLPLDKQIFAAGHELYHLIKTSNEENELLKSKELACEKDVTVKNLNDSKANLFSALLLVPVEALQKELTLMNVQSAKELTLLHIIKLMDAFAVPYKTIVIRLYEIDFINKEQAEEWLEIEDRNPDGGVLFEIKKHQIGERWQQSTGEVKCSDLRAQVMDNQADELFPEEKIEEFMDLIKEASGGNNE